MFFVSFDIPRARRAGEFNAWLREEILPYNCGAKYNSRHAKETSKESRITIVERV